MSKPGFSIQKGGNRELEPKVTGRIVAEKPGKLLSKRVKVGRKEGAFWNQNAIRGLGINPNASQCEIKDIVCDTSTQWSPRQL